MANLENGGSEWRERQMGVEKPVLPKGSRVKRLRMDTRTHIEYGEKTWTTGQTVRDVLQNHLDAHTQEFFEEIVAKIVDTKQLEKLEDKDLKKFDDFTYELYLYRLGLGDRLPEAEAELIRTLGYATWNLPIRPEFLNPDRTLNSAQLQKSLAAIHEQPVGLSFKITDKTNPDDKGQWVDQETLSSHLLYQEQLPPESGSQEIDWGTGWNEKKKKSKPNFRYRISGIEIQDSGSGFDNTLTAFYKSTKTGKRHLRGKFGEGDKMSRTHLVRHGATMRSRSRYFINSGQNKERWWQHRPYLDPEDKKVKLKGVEVEIPKTGEDRFGSSTRIDTQKADPSFAADFSNQVDPRIKDGGLAANCLEYSAAKYYYPMVEQFNIKPVGVSLTANPDFQYIQGLRVGDDNESEDEKYNKKLFSYNFLDSSLLKGRDRNQINQDANYQIGNFWRHAESRELLTAFVKRVYVDDPPEGRYKGAHISYNEDSIISRFLERGSGLDDAQVKRTREMFLDIFIKTLGIEIGKKYVLVTPEDTQKTEKKLLPIMEKRGYTILPIQCKIEQHVLNAIADSNKKAFELKNFEAIKAEMESWDLSEGVRPEYAERLNPVFANALMEFRRHLAALGITNVNVEEQPTFAASVDPDKEQPMEAEFITARQKFRIKIKPDVIFNMKIGRGNFDAPYWQDRMVVELMSTVGRKDGFRERMSAMQHAQDVIQNLLDKSSMGNQEEVSRLLESFHYQEGDERKYQNQFFEKMKNVQGDLSAWAALEKSRDLNLTIADFEQLVRSAGKLPAEYRYRFESNLAKRIVIERGIVGFCTSEFQEKENIYHFHKLPLAQLEVCGEIDGNKVYRLGTDHDRLIMTVHLPDGTVIEDKEGKSVIFKNQILTFKEKYLQIYSHTFSQGAAIDRDVLSINFYGNAGGRKLLPEEKEKALNEFREQLNKIKLIFPENGKLKSMRMLRGVVETPLSVEYGKDEWNNPVRVFQDIVQNHLDAAPNRQVMLQFEVVRGDQRLWVEKSEMAQTDLIVGFAVLDNGSGYAPDDLGTMGKSSKKSPLFSGKYGEGQKMVAAAAARQGLDLRFSSIANYEGKRYRWVGSVGSQNQEIIVGGTPRQEQRVVFNVASQEAQSDGLTSMTAIRLPDDPARYQDPEWQKWVAIIDPRVKDDSGHEGLSRYIIDLREKRKDRVIEMGYMRVLLDEPGAVYENGLLVARRADLAFGYDVPELVSTRERNAYDESKLRSYIGHAYSHCTNPQLAMTVMTKLKEKYLPGSAKNFRDSDIKEQDLSFGRLSLQQLESKPYWNLAASRQFPGMLVTSRNYLTNQIQYIVQDFQKLDSNPDTERLTRLQMTLANLPHIPEDRLLDVSANFYDSWAKILPNAEAYTLNLAQQEVPVDDVIANRLRDLVADRGMNLIRMLGNIASTPEYIKLITESLERPNDYTLKSKVAVVADQAGFWSFKESLDRKPDAVFVAPASAGYLGSVNQNRLGINETLFTPERINTLIGTIDHELVHKITGLGDYRPEFIITLLKLAKYNFEAAI